MRLRNIPGARDAIEKSRFCVNDMFSHKGSWNAVFGNDNRIRLEIGMGKGKFLMETAEGNPDINYIGIEMYSSVLVRALEKAEAKFREEEKLPNFRFIRMDAKEITDAFGEEEIDRIYLNFSDPWPKERHAKRRLTSAAFLERYRHILKPEGTVEFKTDNAELFEYSITQIPEAGWKQIACTYDLHSDDEMRRNNVLTEYEEKFVNEGKPIYKLIIKP